MIVDAVVSDAAKSKLALKADAVFQTIQTMTPEEIKIWIDTNVNDITDIRKVLTLLVLHMKSIG